MEVSKLMVCFGISTIIVCSSIFLMENILNFTFSKFTHAFVGFLIIIGFCSLSVGIPEIIKTSRNR
jgi:hypothetical protein